MWRSDDVQVCTLAGERRSRRMADEVELLEVEILESKIRQLESDKRQLLEENERLSARYAALEANIEPDLNMRISSLQIDERKTIDSLSSENSLLKCHIESLSAERDALSGDLSARNEQIQKMFSEIQELERIRAEEAVDIGAVRRENEQLTKSVNDLDNRIDRMMDDNTVVMLALMTTQSDLEADLAKQTEVLREFFDRTVRMIRETVRMVEEGRLIDGDRGWAEGFDVREISSSVDLMMLCFAAEMVDLRKALTRFMAVSMEDAADPMETTPQIISPFSTSAYDAAQFSCDGAVRWNPWP